MKLGTKTWMLIANLSAAVAVGAPAGNALAGNLQPPEAELKATAEPPQSEESQRLLAEGEAARAKAEEHRQRADEYRRLGGVAYKTGLVREAEWQAAKYEAQAQRAFALARGEEPRALPPEAERYTQLAEQYRRMGGPAYKSGLVAWAEDEARRHGAAAPVAQAAPRATALRPFGAGKPIELWLQPVKRGN